MPAITNRNWLYLMLLGTLGGILCSRAAPGAGPSLVSLDLERDAPGNAFYAVVTVDGTAEAADLSITSSRGTVGVTTRRSEGRYAALVSPDALGSGEYTVTATLAGTRSSLAKTALVLAKVGDAWGQPERVGGPVSTRGWEDGVFVSPDGEWLFVLYAPVSPSCKWTDSTACDHATGPTGAPERPDFIGTERIHPDGTIDNSCLGIDSLPVKLPPCSYWGFHRVADDSFEEPFRIGFENTGGCLCPVGLNVYPHPDGTATFLFSFHDLRKAGADDTGSEYFTVEAPLGVTVNLGTWNGTWPTATIDGFDAKLLPITHAPNELGGNPYGAVGPDGTIDEIWFDNEYVAGHDDIFVTTLAPGGTFPDGPWEPLAKVPAPVSLDGADERMPFFDGTTLTIRRNDAIVSSTFTGTAPVELTTPGAFTDATDDLVPDPAGASEVGAIFTLGEPTLTQDGTLLYFNYGVLRADGLYDLDIGVVRQR